MAYDLKAAFRYWRSKGKNPLFAIAAARADMADVAARAATVAKGGIFERNPYAGREYVSSDNRSRVHPIETENPRSSEKLFHVENPENSGLRLVGRVIPECSGRNGYWDSRGDCGWNTDPYGDTFKDGSGLCYGLVYQLPGRDGHARFVPGFEFGGVDGGPTLDFGNIFESDARANQWNIDPCDLDGARDAARRADDMAKEAAEAEREYQSAWSAGVQYREKLSEMAALRSRVKSLLHARKAAARKDKPAVSASVAELRNSISDLQHEAAELKAGDSQPCFFYRGDKRLQAAFIDGAGLKRFPA